MPAPASVAIIFLGGCLVACSGLAADAGELELGDTGTHRAVDEPYDEPLGGLAGEFRRMLLEFSIVLVTFGACNAAYRRAFRSRKPFRHPSAPLPKRRTTQGHAPALASSTPASTAASELPQQRGLRLPPPNCAPARGLPAQQPGQATPTDMLYTPDPRACRRRLTSFIALNGLDGACARLLRRLAPEKAEWVMDQEFHVSVDLAKGTASAKVVNTACACAALPQEIWETYPTPSVIRGRLEAFARLNEIDDRCLVMLRGLSPQRARKVMDAEFVILTDAKRGTPSAKVVGRILAVQRAD